MRVGYSLKNLPSRRTGADIYAVRVLAELRRIDGENEYYQFFSPPSLAAGKGNFRPLATAGLWMAPPLNVVWHHTMLDLYVRRYGLDLVHVPYLRIPAHCSCPVVATVHDLAEFRTPGHYTLLRRAYRRYVLRWLARRAAHIVTISENSKRDIHELYGIPRERISAVYAGVGPEFRLLGRERCGKQLAARYGLQGPFILYVGALEHPNKNLVRLIRAFARLRELGFRGHNLVVVGAGRGNPRAIYRAVHEEGLEDNIRFLGYVPYADLPLLYNAADVFVYPSLYEGFGLPPVEAMACGLPVACANASSLPEVVGRAAALFDPHDVDDIARTVAALLASESLRDDYAEAGLRQAGRYSWEMAARKTLAVYRAVANGHPAADRGDARGRVALSYGAKG